MMEELQARHRKETRELQARITQKKKSASKKTRKGVNDECDKLEHELRERHEFEIASLLGDDIADGQLDDLVLDEPAEAQPRANGSAEDDTLKDDKGITIGVSHLWVEPKSDSESSQPPKKPSRQKARLARRAAEQEAIAAKAAEEASSLPNLREQERTSMLKQFAKYGLQEKEIRADGHCLYSAVADQMGALGLDLKPKIAPKISDENGGDMPAYRQVRAAAASYMSAHGDDFAPFLEDPLDEHIQKVRDTGEWGGQTELLALAKTYGVKINVLQGDGTIHVIEPAEGGGELEDGLWLAYYRNGFGLGEHYNSLRKAPVP